MIIGCGGSGKSTLSKKVHEITGIPLIHLDQVFWSPGWIETQRYAWVEKNRQIIQNDSWILDGNYGSTMDMRIEAADTIVFLFRPSYVCLYRALKRTLLNFGKTREDLPAGCPDKFELKFFHYIAMYNKTRAPGILKKLKACENDKQISILKNDKAVNDFILKLKVKFK